LASTIASRFFASASFAASSMIRRAASSADLMRASATYLRSRYPRRNPANPARAMDNIGEVAMAGHPLRVQTVRRALSTSRRNEFALPYFTIHCSPRWRGGQLRPQKDWAMRRGFPTAGQARAPCRAWLRTCLGPGGGWLVTACPALDCLGVRLNRPRDWEWRYVECGMIFWVVC